MGKQNSDRYFGSGLAKPLADLETREIASVLDDHDARLNCALRTLVQAGFEPRVMSLKDPLPWSECLKELAEEAALFVSQHASNLNSEVETAADLLAALACLYEIIGRIECSDGMKDFL